MGFVINSPTDMNTGNPTGKSWDAGLKTNEIQEKKQMTDNLTHDELSNAIHLALENLQADESEPELRFSLMHEIFNDYFVYDSLGGFRCKRKYSIVGDKAVLEDTIIKLERPFLAVQSQVTGNEEPLIPLGFEHVKISNKGNDVTLNVSGEEPLLANGDQQRINSANGDSIGHQQLWSRVQGQLDLLDNEHDFHILKELYDTYCVYEVGGKLYKRTFALDENNTVTLSDDVQEVVEETRFEPIQTQQASNQEQPLLPLGFDFSE